MKQYTDLIIKTLHEGNQRGDRTGTGTVSIFGHQMRFNLEEGFPLLTLKKTNFDAIVHELLWFLAGDTNIAYLKANGINIWNEWADEYGDLGPIYGKQWRSWGYDQIANVIRTIKTNPESRRHIVSAWNVEDLENMALQPCHVMFQFYVNDGKLSCHLYQRSADIFLGLPFNIASYALLTHMIAQVCNLEVGELIHTIGDAHIYSNHLVKAKSLLEREPYTLPSLWMDSTVTDIDNFIFSDFVIEQYEHHPAMKAEIAV